MDLVVKFINSDDGVAFPVGATDNITLCDVESCKGYYFLILNQWVK